MRDRTLRFGFEAAELRALRKFVNRAKRRVRSDFPEDREPRHRACVRALTRPLRDHRCEARDDLVVAEIAEHRERPLLFRWRLIREPRRKNAPRKFSKRCRIARVLHLCDVEIAGVESIRDLVDRGNRKRLRAILCQRPRERVRIPKVGKLFLLRHRRGRRAKLRRDLRFRRFGQVDSMNVRDASHALGFVFWKLREERASGARMCGFDLRERLCSVERLVALRRRDGRERTESAPDVAFRLEDVSKDTRARERRLEAVDRIERGGRLRTCERIRHATRGRRNDFEREHGVHAEIAQQEKWRGGRFASRGFFFEELSKRNAILRDRTERIGYRRSLAKTRSPFDLLRRQAELRRLLAARHFHTRRWQRRQHDVGLHRREIALEYRRVRELRRARDRAARIRIPV